MKTIRHLIFIYIIALLFLGCAKSPENATSVFESGNNYILLGFWHGIIIPFSLLGKAIGLNIGLYDAGKDVLSYWMGYIFALFIYAKIIRVLWLYFKIQKSRLKRN